ncbi:MAG: hypothetical protein H5T69_08675 [Chloroflexi bacterium]|nr:hypothetical protein [Chloroflexota bacterium]
MAQPYSGKRDAVVGTDVGPKALSQATAKTLSRIDLFSRLILHRPLRSYQLAAARAIVDSVRHGRGLTLAIMMARQAGKNETAAHIEALLLNLYRRRGGTIVKAAPTFRPQVIHSITRLTSLFEGGILSPLEREQGYLLRLGRARMAFFSAAPGAHVVGATADILLEADEAQDVDEIKWNKDFRPMAASANATTVLWGTAWTRNTLLARTIEALHAQERLDGLQRVFCVPWERVAEEVPTYGTYVRAEIERLGRYHPLIRTQYYLEEIDVGGGMFPPATQALMRGRHPRQRTPTEGRTYALLVDVAGEAEERTDDDLLALWRPATALGPTSAIAAETGHDPTPTRRDSTAVTIVEIVRQPLGLPRFLVVDRYRWTGTPHTQLYGAIYTLAEQWGAIKVVVDATGVGAGLASFLKAALGPRVEPFHFTTQSKSDLGWRFLGICNSGRFLDHRDDASAEYAQFWREVSAADYRVQEGPGRLMRWGVPDPAIHDDLLISAALCATLEELPFGGGPSYIIEADDPHVL